MNSKKPLILILGDDNSIHKMLAKWFEAYEFDVAIETDSLQYLNKAANQKPDIILFHTTLDNSKALAFLEQLKADEHTKFIPVIVISAIDDTDTKVKWLEGGANDYMVEPIDFHELTARVKVQLRISNAQKQLEHQNASLLKQNAQLQHISMTDPLTGLYNRRYLTIRLIEELSRANRYHEPISCLIIDVDHFKAVNDAYGHKIGDMILKQLASLLKRSVRQSDIAVRYGGEEFIIICPNTDLDGAAILAEKLRCTVENHQFKLSGSKAISITVSIGASSLNAESIGPLEKLIDSFISCADDAMYNAKSAGRNCIRLTRVDLGQAID